MKFTAREVCIAALAAYATAAPVPGRGGHPNWEAFSAPSPGPAPQQYHVCPGSPVVCSGNGQCERDGVCWCAVGWGGDDCSLETPLQMEVTSVGPPHLQDMRGIYDVDGMFLLTWLRDKEQKYFYFDQNAQGWAAMKFNSSCDDDMCMFGYQPKMAGRENPPPPSTGYVFGNEFMHIYHRQYVWDMADYDPSRLRGYFKGLSYTHDPQILTPLPDLTEFNGKYVLQPRYTHRENGKYAIFPMDLADEGKKWVMTGLLPQASGPRKWEVIATAIDDTKRRYFAPLNNWQPELFTLAIACANHVQDDTCVGLEGVCLLGIPDSMWIQKCCRSTCQTCEQSRYACDKLLPNNNAMVSLAPAAAAPPAAAAGSLIAHHANVTRASVGGTAKRGLRGGALQTAAQRPTASAANRSHI